MTVMHSYLNALSFFERILYSINVKVLKMNSQYRPIKFTTEEKQILKDAKVITITKAKNSPLYVRIDTHDSRCSGTSNTGNSARKFFSQSARNDVVDLIEGTHQDDISNKDKI